MMDMQEGWLRSRGREKFCCPAVAEDTRLLNCLIGGERYRLMSYERIRPRRHFERVQKPGD